MYLKCLVLLRIESEIACLVLLIRLRLVELALSLICQVLRVCSLLCLSIWNYGTLW